MVFMALEAWALDDRVAVQHAVGRQPAFDVGDDLGHFRFGEMLDRRIPGHIVEGPLWHASANVGAQIFYVGRAEVFPGVTDGLGIEIHRCYLRRTDREETVGEE